MAAPFSSIALASEYVLTLGSVGGVRPAICPLGCGRSMRKFPLELSSFIMTHLIPIAEVQAIVAPAHLEQSEARDLGVETPVSAIVHNNETSRRLKRWEARQRRKSGVPSFPEGRFRPL